MGIKSSTYRSSESSNRCRYGKTSRKENYISVGIEQAGYGERGEKLWKRSTEKTIDASNHLLLLGKTLMGYGASDISSVIDWLLYQNNFLK